MEFRKQGVTSKMTPSYVVIAQTLNKKSIFYSFERSSENSQRPHFVHRDCLNMFRPALYTLPRAAGVVQPHRCGSLSRAGGATGRLYSDFSKTAAVMKDVWVNWKSEQGHDLFRRVKGLEDDGIVDDLRDEFVKQLEPDIKRPATLTVETSAGEVLEPFDELEGHFVVPGRKLDKDQIKELALVVKSPLDQLGE